MKRPGALVVAAALLLACTGEDDGGPTPSTASTTSTSVVDRSGVVLRGVEGETTTTIDDQGTASLVGVVRGPTGPLAGATVRVDRLVAGREVRRDVVTAADGSWELRGVPGGRYRVRAFLPPVFSQAVAEARFLADGAEHTFDLVVEDQRGVVVRADVAPDAPALGAPVNLVVLVVQRTVDVDGVVRSAPLAGAVVELTGLGRWVLRDDTRVGDDTTTSSTFLEPADPTSVLSGAGRARFELVCTRTGAPGLALRVPVVVQAFPGAPPSGATTTTAAGPVTTSETVPLTLPACVDPSAPPPPTTTTAP